MNLPKKIFKQFKNLHKLTKKGFWFWSLIVLVIGLNIFLFIKFIPFKKTEELKFSPAPISTNYLYQSIEQEYKVYLGSRSAKEIPQVKMAVEDSSIGFLPEGNVSKQTKLTKKDDKSVVYENIYPGVNMAYSLKEGGIKEEIILNNQQAAVNNPQFTFKLNLEKAVPQKDLMGNFTSTFVDPLSGNYLFHFEKPFMVDAGGNKSYQVKMEILTYDGQSYVLKLEPDQGWLTSALFPVVIDPTVVHDTQSEFSASGNGLSRVKDVGVGETAPSVELYEQELTADLNTVGLWHMNETSNDTCSATQDACDSSGNGFHGTATGTTITTSSQKLGAAARTIAATNYISVANNVSLNPTNAVTIEAWVYQTSSNTNSGIIYKGSFSSTQGIYSIQVGDGSNSKVVFRLNQSITEGAGQVTSNTILSTNQWYHIVAVYDKQFQKIFINGVEDNSKAYSTAISTDANSLYIGAYYSSSFSFIGTIDEVRISNVARTSEEIKLNAQKRPYGVYTSPSIDLGTSVASLDSLEWSEAIPSSTSPSGGATTDIEFQTRTSANNSTWEEWKPTGVGSTAIDNMDSLSAWNLPSSSIWSGIPASTASETTIKIEGTGSMKSTIGTPMIDTSTKALWHFNETSVGTGSTAYDSSGQNQHLITNSCSLTEGFSNKGRTFNGSSDYLYANASPYTTLTNWSLEAWIKPSNLSQLSMAIYNGNDSGGYGFGLGNGSGSAGAVLQGLFGGVAWLNSGYTFPTANQWYHVVMTRDTGTTRFYVNGAQTASTSSSTPGAVTAKFSVGMQYNSSNSPTRYFAGSVDEVRHYSAVLTAEQIAEAYRASRDHRIERTLSSTNLSSKNKIPFYVAADRPGTYLEAYIGEAGNSVYGTDANTAGLWHLDEKSGSGAYLKDASGNGNHGTPTATTYFSQGKIGGGRFFNGTADQYINLGNNTSLSLTTFTVSAWFQWNSVHPSDVFRTIVSKNSSSSGYNTNYQIYVSDSGPTVQARIGHGTSETYFSCSNIITTNQWYKVDLVYNSTAGTGSIYLNGSLCNSYSSLSTAYTNAAANVTLGYWQGGTYGEWDGLIDEVVISNTPRTADEIRQAYQYGLRTHQITVDYVTTAGSDGPTSTSDYEFTPDSVSGLYDGDTVIVREAPGDGTTYMVQGEVTSISSGAVTVASWSGTAPSGGYSTNADVFKWQKEYWDITDIPTGDRDGITKLGIKVLDGSEGFDAYFDDFRDNQSYLTDPEGGETISSTPQRYFQYRAILSTNDTTVSPSLTSVTLNYTTNNAPSAPDSLLTEGQTNPTGVADNTPEFSAVYNDLDVGDTANTYRIQVDDDDEFGSPIWDSGESGTAMTSCTAGNQCADISYAGSTLSEGTTYYWRIKFWDDEPAEGAWSTEEASFVLDSAPSGPTSLQAESLTNPNDITDTTPEFSAVYNDADSGDIANKYQIQVDDDPAFGSTLWDSGSSGTAMTNCTESNRCSEISYGGASTDLQYGVTYYWRVKFWDDGGNEGSWSTESASFNLIDIYPPSSCIIDDSSHSGETIFKWSDNTTLETGYEVQRNVDGAGFTAFSTEAINATSVTDNTTEADTVYEYRVRATGSNGNSAWCQTEAVNYGKGTFYFQ